MAESSSSAVQKAVKFFKSLSEKRLSNEPPEEEGAGNTEDWQYAEYGGFPGLPKRVLKPKIDKGFINLFIQCYERVFALIEESSTLNFKKEKITCMQDFEDILKLDNLPSPFPRLPPPNLIKSWKEDSTFAAQFLSGVNPMLITRAADSGPRILPEALTTPKEAWEKNLDLLNTYLAKVESSVITVQQLLQEGNLFFVDYNQLVNVPQHQHFLVYAPIVLLYFSKTRQQLMPLAIQLDRQTPQPWQKSVIPNELFIPPVPGHDGDDEVAHRIWLFAKTIANNADGLIHETIVHLGSTHLPMESIVIAAHRQFQHKHPIFGMLQDHFFGTIAINSHGRDTLIAPDNSFFDHVVACGRDGGLYLMESFYRKKWQLSARAVPHELAKRGFGFDIDPLPGYYYREDACRVWAAIEEYCVDSVSLLYKTDEDVVNDKQLQGFLRELRDTSEKGAAMPGVPAVLTRSNLSELLTNIIFTASAQHAAVNFGQYEYYAFQPFRPLSLSKPMPPPAERSEAFKDDNYFISALPNLVQLQATIRAAYILTIPTDDALIKEGMIPSLRLWGSFSSHHAAAGVTEQWSKLEERLVALNKDISERNESMSTPYEYLKPTEIPRSIAI